MDEIKEALESAFSAGQAWAETYVSWFEPSEQDTSERKAIAISPLLARLEAREAKKTVPMAMLVEIDRELGVPGRPKDAIYKVAARYGYAVTE